jgi:hypothetical protein
MEFKRVKLKGCLFEVQGTNLVIKRQTVRPESISGLILDQAASSPMEQACVLSGHMWNSAFFAPEGEKDDLVSFMTIVVMVREDLEELVRISCQPRHLEPEKKDKERYDQLIADALKYRKE